MKIAVSTSSFGGGGTEAADLLLDKGIEIVTNPYGRKMTEDEIIKHLEGADGLLAGVEPLTERVFKNSPKLRAIARVGVGMDSVDVEAAGKYGIKVSNTPDAPTDAVAEMALAALLAIGHQIIPCNRDMHNHVWKKRIGFSLKGLNVLIAGYGRIGQKFAMMLQNMGCNIIIYDPYKPEISEKDLNEALSRADVVSIHASGKEELLTEETFRYMKDGIVIMNCARGALVNEAALCEGLKSGRVSWFWGDVFQSEPYGGRLLEIENAILTPHISTYNTLCRKTMEMEAVLNLLEDLGIG